jgi:hypothetical protein
VHVKAPAFAKHLAVCPPSFFPSGSSSYVRDPFGADFPPSSLDTFIARASVACMHALAGNA